MGRLVQFGAPRDPNNHNSDPKHEVQQKVLALHHPFSISSSMLVILAQLVNLI